MKLACIFMASGYGKRFGGNKLLTTIEGKTIAEYVWDQFPADLFQDMIVVTEYRELARIAEKRGFRMVENKSGKDDISITIRLGMAALSPDIEGCLFAVCDQPFLRKESIVKMQEVFLQDKSRIVALGYQEERGNPVIFPKALFQELEQLDKNRGGSAVIRHHSSLLQIVEAAEEKELQDIDTETDLLLF